MFVTMIVAQRISILYVLPVSADTFSSSDHHKMVPTIQLYSDLCMMHILSTSKTLRYPKIHRCSMGLPTCVSKGSITLRVMVHPGYFS